MNYYIVSAYLNAISSFSMAFFVCLKNRKTPLNRWFIVFALGVAFWSLFYAFWLCVQSHDNALFWVRLAVLWSAVIPVAFTEFVLRLTDNERKYRLARCLNFFAFFLILTFSFTRFFIRDVHVALNFLFWPVPGPVFYFFHMFFALNIVTSHVLLIKKWFTSAGVIRTRLRLVFIVTSVGFLGGMTNHLLWYGIPIPPVGNIAIALFIPLLAYAIVAHQLMDIEVIIKRTLVFAGLFAMAMLVVGTVTTLIQRLFGSYLPASPMISTAISVILAILLYDPTRRFLLNLTDKFLFQKKINYRLLLKDASKEMAAIKSLKRLTKMVVAFLVTRGRLKSAAAFVFSLSDDVYVLRASRPYLAGADRLLRKDHLVVKELSTLQGPLSKETLETWTGEEKDRGRKERLSSCIELFTELRAEAAVPSFLYKEENVQVPVLRSILFLGPKKSDEPYTQEDLDVFFTLGQESSIAFENARLYDEAVERAKELEQANLALKDAQGELVKREKLAVVAKLVRDIAHEIQNPLMPIRARNESLRNIVYVKFLEAYERVKDNVDEAGQKEFDEAFLDLYEASEAIEKNVDHIYLVMDTLRNSAAGDVETVGPLDFKSLFKEVRSLLEAHTADPNGRVEIIDRVDKDLPPVRGNAAQLQQVVLNLYKNAQFAMNGQSKKHFIVSARIDDDDRLVRLEFSDTGVGIPRDVMGRLFTRGFTTKGEKGSGAGLYQSKIIIEHFGGTIDVQSEVGQGTTFIIRLPIVSGKGSHD